MKLHLFNFVRKAIRKLLLLLSIIQFTSTTFVAAQSVNAWVTNGDQSKLLQQQSAVNFGTSTNSTKITLNEGTTYQTIDGFGFTLTEGSAEVIYDMAATQQNTLLNEIFNTSSGVGVSVIRISIGASDMSSSDYSYNEVAGDVNMTNFSLAGPDLTYLVPIIKKILAINPNVKFLATPWTALRWMKTNNSWIGGSLNTAYYAAYATYFVKYLDAMKAQGITIWGITPQNEPENPNNEPSMSMSATEQLNFINNNLGPAIRNAGYSTKIICFDHNCDNTSYPTTVCNGSSYVDGAAFHMYGGSISAMTTVHNATGKNVYFTEQYTGVGGNFASDLSWHMQNVMLGSVNNWSKIALEWNLATNSSYGPRTPGGCTTCLGAYTITSSTAYTKNISYYLVAQMSKVIKPNAVKIATSATNSGLINAAFINSDGSRALVVFNNTGASSTFDIVWNGQAVAHTLVAGAVASFLWSSGTTVAVTGVTMSPTSVSVATGATTQLTATVAPSNATNKTVSWSSSNSAVASVSSSGLVTRVAAGSATITVTTQDGAKTATCAITVTSTGTNIALNKPATSSSNESGYTAAGCNDGNTGSRWSSAFSDPQWVMIDLQASYNITKVVLNWEAAAGKSYQVQVSSDNTNWTSIYSTTAGAGGIVTLNITGTGRYIRMYGTTRTTVYGYSLWEFEVYGTINTTTVPVTGVTLSPTTASITTGSTTQLTATVAPSNATNKNVTWSSSNTAIASVSSTGLVTGIAVGSATITVTTQDGAKTATCAVTVTSSTIAVTGVTVSPTSASINLGATQQLTTTVSPTNATNKTVTWSSSNTAIASVNSTGLVTAVAAGTATITVTTQDGAKTATCAVTVTTSTSTFPGYYNVISRSSLKGLDVADNSTTSGGRIQQWDITSGGGNNQRWRLDDAGSGYYYIKVKSTQMCLSLASTSTADGIKAVQQTCNSSNTQKWALTSIGSGYYYITNVYSGKALDVEGVSTANGANIQVWTYGGGTNQQWSFVQVEATKSSEIATSIAHTDAGNDLSYYPNPASSFIHLKSEVTDSYNSIEIYSLNGSILYSQNLKTISNNSINIESLKSGVYLIKLSGNNAIKTEMLIKQ
jgi:glucosylceramidase